MFHHQNVGLCGIDPVSILKGLLHSAQGWTAAGRGGRSYPGERSDMTPSTLKGLHPLPSPLILSACLNRWPR
jgi:hypothetical protein